MGEDEGRHRGERRGTRSVGCSSMRWMTCRSGGAGQRATEQSTAGARIGSVRGSGLRSSSKHQPSADGRTVRNKSGTSDLDFLTPRMGHGPLWYQVWGLG